MKIYFSPFACSLAARIAINEAELDAEYVQVKRDTPLPDGRAFTAVSPMGYVPALETASLVLTEGPAILSYIADLAAEGVLAPPLVSNERYQMIKWLNLIATEVHQGGFTWLFRAQTSGADTSDVRARLARPFAVLSAQLEQHDYLVGSFSVADAYLLAVLNWCEPTGVPIADWPVLLAWRERLRQRPSVAAAMATELPLRMAA